MWIRILIFIWCGCRSGSRLPKWCGPWWRKNSTPFVPWHFFTETTLLKNQCHQYFFFGSQIFPPSVRKDLPRVGNTDTIKARLAQYHRFAEVLTSCPTARGANNWLIYAWPSIYLNMIVSDRSIASFLKWFGFFAHGEEVSQGVAYFPCLLVILPATPFYNVGRGGGGEGI